MTTMRASPLAFLPAAMLLAGCAVPSLSTEAPMDTYAIVASKAVMDDPVWKRATVDALMAKHPGATLIVWDKSVDEARGALTAALPSHTAFVVKPEQAGAMFTIAVSTLCRALDDDPFTDTFWGVVTGYDAPAAKALAEAKPIAIRRALDCAGCDLTAFDKAWRYTEDHRGTMNFWARGATDKIQDIPCDTDNTWGVLERLRTDRVQFMTTSGHATQRDWQMGYRGPNMAMVHQDGRLFAIDTKKQRHPAGSTEPKVYFGTGNCLIGDIDKPDCMALSWMRDGGARQFMGYTITTWFGAQGWGTQGLFVDTAGLCTANEAFHFTNTGIVDKIRSFGIPDMMTFRFTQLAKQSNFPITPGIAAWQKGRQAAGDKPDALRQALFDRVGHLHDRDVVCFYGDPALDARIADGRWTVLPPLVEDGALTLRVRANPGVREKSTVWVRLPGSWRYDPAAAEVPEALGKADLLLDNMIRIPDATPSAGETYTIRLPGATRKGA